VGQLTGAISRRGTRRAPNSPEGGAGGASRPETQEDPAAKVERQAR
jgi:hypothetical protein